MASGTIDRTALAEVWAEIIDALPTGGTRRERQAYGNGVRDALDAIADFLRLDLGTDPWDSWTAPGDDEAKCTCTGVGYGQHLTTCPFLQSTLRGPAEVRR